MYRRNCFCTKVSNPPDHYITVLRLLIDVSGNFLGGVIVLLDSQSALSMADGAGDMCGLYFTCERCIQRLLRRSI